MAAKVAVAQRPTGNLKPAKVKSTERIDGIVPTIMAIDRALVAQEEPPPSYQAGTMLGNSKQLIDCLPRRCAPQTNLQPRIWAQTLASHRKSNPSLPNGNHCLPSGKFSRRSAPTIYFLPAIFGHWIMQSLVRSLLRRSEKKNDNNPFFNQRVVAPRNRGRSVAHPAKYYLTIATVLRNEGLYIREWVAFYKAVGVDHVLIYDNDSTDGFQVQIRDHLASGFVEVIPWPHFVEEINFQHLGFAHAVSYMAGRTTWLALIDLDEFLFSTRSVRLVDTLSDYEDLPVLAVYWMNYGTSGHRTRPQGLVIENFTRRTADNGLALIKNFKSIVQPDRVKATLGAHRFLTDLDPVIAFNENRVPLTDNDRHKQLHTAEILRINHYFSRSREEFETRSREGWAHYRQDLTAKREVKLHLIERDEIEDDVITRIVPHMRPWLGEGGPSSEQFAACSPLRVIGS